MVPWCFRTLILLRLLLGMEFLHVGPLVLAPPVCGTLGFLPDFIAPLGVHGGPSGSPLSLGGTLRSPLGLLIPLGGL